MTISSTLTKTIYGGNGSTATFAVPFMFTRNEDIEVVLTDIEGLEIVQTISTNYQLAGAGDQTGGTCTMTIPPEAGQTLVIRRNPAMVQEVDYVENDAFPAATHEAALDKLTMICQTLSERLDRTISFRVSSAVSGIELPQPDPGRALAWNESGDDLVNKVSSDLDAVLLPLAVAEGGTGGTNLDEALTGLGFGTAGKAVSSSETTLEAAAALNVEPADPTIVRSDVNDQFQAVYGDEAQVHVGTDLSALVVNRNHISWTLTEASQLSEISLPNDWDGVLFFHIYPEGNTLSIATNYKTAAGLALPDPAAGEIRVVVEQYNSRKTIVSLQNVEV